MKEMVQSTGIPEMEESCSALFDFCRAHKRIFLYGAGDYAEMYTVLLNRAGFSVEAYIVSSAQHAGEFMKRPIFCADAAKSILEKGDGIIPAFKGCTPQLVMEMLGVESDYILEFDQELAVQAAISVWFEPILRSYRNNLPQQCDVLPKDGIHNILVIRIDFIGDMICSTAFFRELKRNYPNASVSLLCNKMNESLMRDCPYIDRLYLYEQNDRNRGLVKIFHDYRAAESKIKEFVHNEIVVGEFDLLFLARNVMFGSALLDEILLALNIEAKYKVASVLRDGSGISSKLKRKILVPFFSKIVYSAGNCPVREEPLVMLRECGLKVKDTRIELWVSENEKQWAENLLAVNGCSGKKMIAVALKGSGKNRCWDKNNFRALFEKLIIGFGNRLSIVILGGKDAVEDAEELADMENVVSFAGKLSLKETAAVLSRCDLYIGPSTAILHMATALRIPSVTLYHILDEETDMYELDGPPKWAPDDSLPHVSLLPPPGLDGCHGVCRMPYAHCINLITPNQVNEAAHKLLIGDSHENERKKRRSANV